MIRQGAAVVCAICLPLAAHAECTGGNCYNGLGLLIGGLLLAAVVVAGLIIALLVLLFKKRWAAAKVIGGMLGIIAALGLMFLV